MARTAELPPKIQDALNAQLKDELASSYTYLAMAAYLETAKLPGAATWMRMQAQEELGHAMRFYDFVHDRNGRVVLGALPAPAKEWTSPLRAFEEAHANEQKVTENIVRLYELAMAEKDYVSHAFLQAFLTEQIEEEKTASRIVDMLNMAGDSRSALLMVDKELGARSKAE
ncbi:MAG TPA: ferritin [Candidatus Thermoplasmatota archaeon]|nr:ferritin [Candidatus Thermoplasmatota archaeon]